MTTTERTGDTPVAPLRRTKTAAAAGEPTAPQADSAAPRPQARVPTTPAVAVLGPARTTTLTALAPAPPRTMKVAGAMAVPSPRPLPEGEGEVERAPGATFTVKAESVDPYRSVERIWPD